MKWIPIWLVHPHGRGEHSHCSTENPGHAGSSPRAWGTLHRGAPVWTLLRFIPTGVGNTRAWWPMPSPAAVHPHGRGEHDDGPDGKVNIHGSSPRAWGTRRPRLRGSGRAAVHPHGRGEHTSSISMNFHGNIGSENSTDSCACRCNFPGF